MNYICCLIILFVTQTTLNMAAMNCSYWGFNEVTDQWDWLTDGVFSGSLNQTNNTTFVCYTRHLTNFAVIAVRFILNGYIAFSDNASNPAYIFGFYNSFSLNVNH